MEETYNVKAIILNRRPVGESDSRITAYSHEKGKLELTARGTKKIKSKLAGHLEPFNLADIMVARGQKYDYVGTAVSEKCFSGVKNNLEKLTAAGQAVKIVDRLIKPGVADKGIFELLKDYLEILNKTKADPEILTSLFIFKLLANLGHQPELSRCLNCGGKIQPGKNRFDFSLGGLVCEKCADPKDANQPASQEDRLVVSDDAIKLLRLALKSDFKQLGKVKVGKKLGEDVAGVIEKFFRYSF